MIAQVSDWAESTGIERGYNTTFEDELAVHIDPYRLIDRFEVEIAIWRRRVLLREGKAIPVPADALLLGAAEYLTLPSHFLVRSHRHSLLRVMVLGIPPSF